MNKKILTILREPCEPSGHNELKQTSERNIKFAVRKARLRIGKDFTTPQAQSPPAFDCAVTYCTMPNA
jgi:hypothetical protein